MTAGKEKLQEEMEAGKHKMLTLSVLAPEPGQAWLRAANAGKASGRGCTCAGEGQEEAWTWGPARAPELQALL